MRLLLDTNVVVSGLLWAGPPWQLLNAARAGRIELVSSEPLFDELTAILTRRKLQRRLNASGWSVGELIAQYRMWVTLVTPISMAPLAPDPDDDVVIATAVAGHVDYLVTGDAPLLSIKPFSPVPMLTAREASNVLFQN